MIEDQALYRPTDIEGNYADPEKTARTLGWKATIKMDEAVRQMVATELESSTATAPR